MNLANHRRSTHAMAALACAGFVVALSAGSGAQATTVTTVYQIPVVPDGAYPGPLTGYDGVIYGITQAGGATGDGTIFRLDRRTGSINTVFSFGDPSLGIGPVGLSVMGGKLYGVTQNGGANDGGVVFAFDPRTAAATRLYDLPAYTAPLGKLVGLHGLLYGAGKSCSLQQQYGCLFSVDPDNGTGQIVYNLVPNVTGEVPTDLVRHGEALFATTSQNGAYGGGTLFRFDPAGGSAKVEHAFGASGDAKTPTGLVDDGSLLYGTTAYSSSDSAGLGTIFSFDPQTNTEATVQEFDSPVDGGIPAGGLVVGDNGLLYGVTGYDGPNQQGTVYTFDPTTTQLAVVYAFDGPGEVGHPTHDVIEKDGLLYGADGGGPANAGLVYSVDPADNRFTGLHNFATPDLGSLYSVSPLIRFGSGLFATATVGGEYGQGSIVRIDPANGAGQSIYSFKGPEGSLPRGALLDVGGVLYGTCSGGGIDNAGTVFAFDPRTGSVSTKASFTDATGGLPYGPLTASGASLYGIAQTGGLGHGTIFRFDLQASTLAKVASFSKATGYNTTYVPAGLVAAGGKLYGTAQTNDSRDSRGTIFAYDPTTGSLSAVYTFQGHKEGAVPFGGLTYGNGLLFGSTNSNRIGRATVFSFDPTTETQTTLHDFPDDFSFLTPPVIKGDKLYVPVMAGSSGGVVRVNISTGASKLISFPAGPSQFPQSSLLPLSRGLFGTAIDGKSSTANGSVFKLNP